MTITGSRPQPRSNAGMVAYQNGAVLFGGFVIDPSGTGLAVVDDTWVFTCAPQPNAARLDWQLDGCSIHNDSNDKSIGLLATQVGARLSCRRAGGRVAEARSERAAERARLLHLHAASRWPPHNLLIHDFTPDD